MPVCLKCCRHVESVFVEINKTEQVAPCKHCGNPIDVMFERSKIINFIDVLLMKKSAIFHYTYNTSSIKVLLFLPILMMASNFIFHHRSNVDLFQNVDNQHKSRFLDLKQNIDIKTKNFRILFNIDFMNCKTLKRFFEFFFIHLFRNRRDTISTKSQIYFSIVDCSNSIEERNLAKSMQGLADASKYSLEKSVFGLKTLYFYLMGRFQINFSSLVFKRLYGTFLKELIILVFEIFDITASKHRFIDCNRRKSILESNFYKTQLHMPEFDENINFLGSHHLCNSYFLYKYIDLTLQFENHISINKENYLDNQIRSRMISRWLYSVLSYQTNMNYNIPTNLYKYKNTLQNLSSVDLRPNLQPEKSCQLINFPFVGALKTIEPGDFSNGFNSDTLTSENHQTITVVIDLSKYILILRNSVLSQILYYTIFIALHQIQRNLTGTQNYDYTIYNYFSLKNEIFILIRAILFSSYHTLLSFVTENKPTEKSIIDCIILYTNIEWISCISNASKIGTLFKFITANIVSSLIWKLKMFYSL